MKKFLLIIIGISLLFSCKKELTDDLISEEITSDEITKDYLTFKSSDEFFSVLDSLNELSADQIMWYKSDEGFVSLFTIRENYYECLDFVTDEISYNNLLIEYCDVLSQDDPLQFKVFCKNVYPVINREGIVKIGNNLYKFTEDGQIILKNNDVDRLSSLTVSDKESDDVTIFKYKDYINSKDDCGYYQSRIDVENYDGDRRASLWSFIDFIWVYQGGGQYYYHTYVWNEGIAYKKKLFGWSTYKTNNYLNLNYRATLNGGISSQVTLNLSNSNQYHIQYNDLLAEGYTYDPGTQGNYQGEFEWINVNEYTHRGMQGIWVIIWCGPYGK